MSTDLKTIGHMLRDQGYYTAYKGKWHESEIAGDETQDAMEPYGFSDYQANGDFYGEPYDGFTKDHLTAAETTEWFKSKGKEVGAKGQPWYLAVNFINPHDIMYFDTDGEKSTHTRGMFPIFSEPDDDIYKPKWETELPVSFDNPRTQHPPAVQFYKEYIDGSFGHIPDERKDLWHNHINYQINCMRDVDRHIGTVLDTLEETGFAENTIIFFSSDHGEMATAHGLRQKGSIVFKEVINVPFIIVHPDGPKGVQTGAVGSHVDLVPTMLAFAGLSEAERKDKYPQLIGHDLSGVVADPTSHGPRGSTENPGIGCLITYEMLATFDAQWLMENAEYVLDTSEHRASARDMNAEEIKALVERIDLPKMTVRNLYRCIFDGLYKLVRYFGLEDYTPPESVEDLLKRNDVGLYDLQNDPDEMNNLANPNNPDYDEELLGRMNAKLNALIMAEIAEDKALIGASELE